MTLANYIEGFSDFGRLSITPSKLIPFFALYLEIEDPRAAILPKHLGPLFDEARVRQPANISDSMRKSKAFIKVKGGGYRLSRDTRERLLSTMPRYTTSTPVNEGSGAPIKSGEESRSGNVSKRNVFVIYGRDQRLRRDLFSLLRAMGVHPFEFEEMAHLTGSTSPSTWEVIRVGFANAQACVAFFSPDELAVLRQDLRGEDDSDKPELQPRPNVLVETGMALATFPMRTIVVKTGPIREISDLDGMQYVNLTGSAESRNKLLHKLQLAGCEVKTHGDDWLNVGNFKPNVQ